jgi:molybdenum cofactor biosynthesis enzyme MoaA
MDAGKTHTPLQKIINGVEYSHNRELDVIFEREVSQGPTLNRTQSDQSVDLCAEVTRFCNWTCRNCFSNSIAGVKAKHTDVDGLIADLQAAYPQVIRICLTGGEPLLHPRINRLLKLPQALPHCSFVLSTNGSSKPSLDDTLVKNGWIVAISLHGQGNTHDEYTRSSSFETVKRRIEALAPRTIVHIYTVLNSRMSYKDLDWLVNFRETAGAAFLRFIIPRPFGRNEDYPHKSLIRYAQTTSEPRVGVKTDPSNTQFRSVEGQFRMAS